MALIRLENELLAAEISTFGAELQSIYGKKTQKEYLWQGEKAWPRRAPILFPIVGRLKNGTYTWCGKSYALNQHGFARDMDFQMIETSTRAVKLRLTHTKTTLEQFPFKFEFDLTYTLEDNKLCQTFDVRNLDESPLMPVSFGAHPAFNVSPLTNFSLHFQNMANGKSDTVIDGIRSHQKRAEMEDHTIQLTETLFDDDALIFNAHGPETITIQDKDRKALLKMTYNGFSHLGIWSKPKAPFVCLEPWLGVADSTLHEGQIEKKEGIIMVPRTPDLQKSLTMTFEL